jgi:hypothetical protein
MNANEIISRMTEIEAAIGAAERDLAGLRSEGIGLWNELEAFRKGLSFAPAVAAPAQASRNADRSEGVDTALKLCIKRTIQKKAKEGGSAIELSAVAGVAALRVAQRRGMPEVPAWVSGWADTQIAKLFPSPVEAPAEKIEKTGEIGPVPVDASKPSKRKK